MSDVDVAIIGFLACTAVAVSYAIRALKETRSGGGLSRALFLGSFAKKDAYTEQGWRYRNLCMRWQTAAFVACWLLLVIV